MTLVRSAVCLVLAQLTMFIAAGRLHGLGSPDVVVAVLAMVAVCRPQIEAVLLAAAVGLVADAFTAEAFGTRAVTLLLVAYLVSSLAPNLNAGSVWVRCALVVSALLASLAVEALLRWSVESKTMSWSGPRPIAILVTAVLGIILWPLLTTRRLEART